MPEPLFILCPPRSYSSLIGTMLGQHPQCYGLPELNLFVADDLAGVWRWAERIMPHGRDGLLRVLAELTEGTQSEAAVDRAAEWVMRHGAWSPRQVLVHIQEMVGDKRLVEKSPSTVLNPDGLRRLAAAFPQADFLHLVRHPTTTCRSMVSLLARGPDLGGRAHAQVVEPARIWLEAHTRILEFAQRLPLGQCLRIKGEALLADPPLYLRQIVEWLGLCDDDAAIEAMMHPERSPYARLGPSNASHGNDPDFISHPSLDFDRLRAIDEPPLAEAEGDDMLTVAFAKVRKYASQMGYA
jgi:hypothetical protein